MNVLQVTTNYPTDRHPIFGIFMKEQADSVTRQGAGVTVFFSNGKEKGGMEHIRSIGRLFVHLLRNRYDVIHCHHIISGVILILSGGAFFHKCVLSYENDPDRENGGFWFRFAYPFFNRIILKNPSRYLKYRKTVCLPNGVDSRFFVPMDKAACRRQLGMEPDALYFLFMDSNKGKRTQKRRDRFDRAVRILEERHGLKNILPSVHTNTPRELIPAYMNACDLHLLSSDFEGSPNSVKECLCCNTPVVSTDVGNVREMMGGIEGCYVADTFTAEELAEGVLKVLACREFHGRDALLANGYDIDRVGEKLYNLYKTL